MKVLVLFFLSVSAFASTGRKNLDILFVIDNSGSMLAAQKESCRESGGLLSELKKNKINYHIGVTTTEAWKARFSDAVYYATLRDGSGDKHSGVYVITPNTPNAEEVLAINLEQGISGSGDERAFDSALQALVLPENKGFQRKNTPLAIVVLSDEDDFSSSQRVDAGEDYSNPNLFPIADILKAYKQLAPKVSVSTIDIRDQVCLSKMHAAGNIGIRYQALSKASKGVQTSICEVGASMKTITKHLVAFARK